MDCVLIDGESLQQEKRLADANLFFTIFMTDYCSKEVPFTIAESLAGDTCSPLGSFHLFGR